MRAAAFLLLACLLVSAVPLARADSGLCGTTITSDLTLTGDVGPCDGTAFTIDADGAVLNCAGFKILGTGTGWGALSIGHDKVTIKNCLIDGFNDGVILDHSSHSVVVDVKVVNSNNGFYFGYLSDSTIERDFAVGSSAYGFIFFYSDDNLIKDSTAENGCYLTAIEDTYYCQPNYGFGFTFYTSSRNEIGAVAWNNSGYDFQFLNGSTENHYYGIFETVFSDETSVGNVDPPAGGRAVIYLK